MQNLIIYQFDGTPYPLQRYYPLTSITKATQVCELLGQDVVEVDFESVQHLEMQLGWRIQVFGRSYTLNVLPEETKNSKNQFVYKCTFEGVQYDLMHTQYFDTGADGVYTASDFPLTGDLEMFIDVLINNCARTFGPGVWVKGQVQTTEVKTLSFSTVNCLQALQQVICKEFEVEFEIEQAGNVKTLHVRKAGQVLGDTYEYGMGKGLYTLTRRPVKETNIVNRLYPLGSTENLKADYRGYSTRLKIGDIGSDYLEDQASIDAYGKIEGVKIFEDVKPGRIGVVTGVGAGSPGLFFDATMDFDLAESDENGTKYLVAGKSPKIHFNTGDLAGYEFELVENGYFHDEKSFEIIPIKDSKGLDIPGSVEPFTIKVGDKYVILDIVMPETYITAAEAELRTKGQLFLDANKNPLIQYGLKVDPQYLKNKSGAGSIPNFFGLGDYIQIKDADLNIDKASRVIKFSRNVLDAFEYTVEVADSYSVSTIVRVVSDVKTLNNIIQINNLQNPMAQKQAWRSAQEVANIYFDPDGYLKDGKIRAETIETAVALIGVDSGQFQILGAKFMANYLGDKNVVYVSGGQLVHLTVEAQIRTWIFNATSVTIADNSARYVYARCNRTGADASIIFSTEQIKPKQDGSYYHFLLGILNAVDSNTQTRALNLTYGFTLIAGEHITTGIIRSADGYTFFNLNTGEIGGRITFRTPEGLNKPISQLETELKGMIQDVAEQTDGQVESWFMDGLPTLSNQPAVSWTSAEIKRDHVGDNYFDRISKKTYRFKEENGVFSWEEVSDDRITQAMLLASLAKDTADGKRRIFVAQPFPPYDPGDAWAKDGGFMICRTQRVSGSFNALDWDTADVYDNTVTAINGGMAVTGSLYLANEDGTIKAFIRGGGQGDNVILLGLGASPENAEFAPLRVRRGGALESRSRVELFNSSNVGVAGICGINSAGDGNIVAFFGSNYAGRSSAPTNIDLNGKLTTRSAKIGQWDIDDSGFTNLNGTAYIIARSANNNNKVTEAMIGANVWPGSTGGAKGAARFRATEDNDGSPNVAAYFEAENATGLGVNYAIWAAKGLTALSEAQINGRRTYSEVIGVTTTRGVDPSLYDTIAIHATGGTVGLGFFTPSRPIKSGKEVTVMSTNDDRSVYLVNIVRNRGSVDIAGGNVCTLIYIEDPSSPGTGYWYIKSMFNNDY